MNSSRSGIPSLAWGCILVVGFLPLLVSPACGDSRTTTPKPKVRIAQKFAAKDLDPVWAIDKLDPQRDPVRASITEAVRTALVSKGYRVVAKGPSHVRLLVTVHYFRGPTLEAFARKMGFSDNVGPEEEYWLNVHVRITVMEQDVYSAMCRMWHKFIPSEREHSVDWNGDEVWPIDHFGAGPNNLDAAAEEIVPLLTKDLPRRNH